jgi:diaminohydroxyphosphoribosylaminopyrimidine deaminase/5-amino-6-(5-phosphoribosylamino)uracil reductase
MNSIHQKYMRLAIIEAQKGIGFTRPNPIVGAVLVKDQKVINSGHHEYFGGPHAEVNALKNIEDASGSTLYCTLEPCCHHSKKTPPCAPLIISKKVSTVVIAMLDPNPMVSGKGVQLLEENGIEVIVGVCESESRNLNKAFIKNMTKQMPFIHLKMAQTLDGKMVLDNNVSKWITGEQARTKVQTLRAQSDAILIGGQTFKHDNPSLNVREKLYLTNPHFKQPKKIIVSKKGLKISEESKILLNQTPLLFENILNWNDFFKKIYKEHAISSVLVEAGPMIIGQLIKENLFDQISLFIASKIAMSGVSLQGPTLTHFDQAHQLQLVKTEVFENGDLALDLFPKEPECLQD